MRQPKICQRKRRGITTYYCEIAGKQYGLGRDLEGAQSLFAELLVKNQARKKLGVDKQPEAAEKPLTVRAVLLAFLESVKDNSEQSEATYRFYAQPICSTAKKSKGFVSFDDYLSRQGKSGMLVRDFGPEVVNDWLNKHFPAKSAENPKGYSSNYRHNLVRPIQAAFNWAKASRRDWRMQLADDPLTGLKKPTQTPREAYIDAEQWAKIMATLEGEFLDFLIVLKETGARPQEARMVEAKHFDNENRRWYFPKPPKKVRGEQKARIVLLNDKAFAICQRLALKHREGPLFRNERGEPWTKSAMNSRCQTLDKKLGFRLQPYAIRHTFCTDALKRSVDPLTVAKLMGHANGLMVMKVYSQLGLCDDHLRAALVKATG